MKQKWVFASLFAWIVTTSGAWEFESCVDGAEVRFGVQELILQQMIRKPSEQPAWKMPFFPKEGAMFWQGREDYARIGKGWMHPGNVEDVVLVFTAPEAASGVRVSGIVRKLHLDGDGVLAMISCNGKKLWSSVLEGKDKKGFAPDLTVSLEKGDMLCFSLNSRKNHICDATAWSPCVLYPNGKKYDSAEAFSDKQENNGWSYRFLALQQKNETEYYTLGKNFQIRKGLDICARECFPVILCVSGNSQNGFSGKLVALDTEGEWKFTARANGFMLAGGAPVYESFEGTWIEGLNTLARLRTTPKLSADLRRAYEQTVKGTKIKPDLDLFLLCVSEWVLDKDSREKALDAGFWKQGEWEQFLKENLVRRDEILSASELNSFRQILFTLRRNPQWNHEVAQYFGWRQRPDGGLFVLEQPGKSLSVRNVVENRLPRGNFLEPRLSYDAKKIYFSFVATEGDLDPNSLKQNAKEDNHHYFHLYEINLDGTGLRQLTHEHYDDMMPEPLPDGDIMFVSTRREASSRCFWWAYSQRWHSYTLFRMHPDGTGITQLSWNDVNDWFPSVANNGQVLFARWDYIDRDAVTHQNLWSVRPDGTNPMAVWGNETPTPHCVFQAKSIPGSVKIVAVASAHHAITGGPVMIIDSSKGNNLANAVQRITPERYPESEGWTSTPYYNAPYPLSENRFLVAYSRESIVYEQNPARMVRNPDYALGLYVLDGAGNRALLYRNGVLGATNPQPIAPRPIPPVLPSIVDERLASEGKGEVFLSDVYDGLPSAERGSLKWIRIVQVFPKTTRDGNVPRIGVAGEENTRAVLGKARIEADGSSRFLVPAKKPFYFQVLDADGLAYRTMRSSTSLMPGERVSCVGCHENKMAVSAAKQKIVAAMKRPAEDLLQTPECGRPYGFVEQIQPILDARCVKCHSGNAPKAALSLSRKLAKNGWTESYYHLCFDVRKKGYHGHARRTDSKSKRLLVPCYEMRNQVQTTPEGGEKMAMKSGLIELLRKGHGGCTAEEISRIGEWIDLNAVFYGVYEPEEDLQRCREGKPVAMPKRQ